MSPWLPGVLLTCTAFVLAVAGPGPNVLAVTGVSMSDGRRAGVAGAPGVAATFSLSLVAHVAYAIAFSAPVARRLDGRARRGLEAAFGLCFVVAGGRLPSARS